MRNALAIYELQAGNRRAAGSLIQRPLELHPDSAGARQVLQAIGQ